MKESGKAEGESDDATDDFFTTIKIMASEVGQTKGLDVRLGINQHYPSFKPPPFPYHNRTPAASVASATNFTTHNIPQTFSTAIRCTKCGKGFVDMPELHKHILSCANASDKRRYTPKKNPIPLRTFAKAQNGVLSSTNSTNGQNALLTVSQINRPKLNQQTPAKLKLNALNKRKKQLVQKAISQRMKSRQQQPNSKDCRHRVRGPVTRSLQQVVTKASMKEQQVANQEPPRKLQDPSV
ncbi:hypothetical protein DPEC_G00007570 [Dallia pectoralis]|uniref:Uncharacterized protein n=1 Tax=Dallia pectoralis TaxID=75939 RepID=A0ACC2HKS8_DALPE|nr:hypothetical protein DPEC_G00007570 [Dallia pectoralis]